MSLSFLLFSLRLSVPGVAVVERRSVVMIATELITFFILVSSTYTQPPKLLCPSRVLFVVLGSGPILLSAGQVQFPCLAASTRLALPSPPSRQP